MIRLRHAVKVIIAVTMAFAFLYISSAAAVAATTLVVTGSSLNLRVGPGTSYKVVAGLTKGEKVTLVASKPGWLQVKTAQGKLGWANSMFLGTISAASVSKPTNSGSPTTTTGSATVTKVQITGKTVNLRQAASTSSALAGSCKQGDLLTWKKTLPGWYQVITAGGKTAYVSSSLSVIKKITAVPAAAAGTKQPTTVARVQVTGKSVNLRQSPSTSGALAGSCKQGDLLTWKKTLSGWYQVITADGKTAYISSTLAVLKQVAQAPTPASSSQQPTASTPQAPTAPVTTNTDNRAGKLQVIGSTVNLRSGPGTSYSIVSKVSKDQVLYASQEEDGWYEVVAAGDDRAWIIASLVRIITPLAASNTTVTTPSSGVTPSRGDDNRPELEEVTIKSGEDSQGDFLSLIGGDGVSPVVTMQGDTATVYFPNSRLSAQGSPASISLNEDSSLKMGLVYTTRDNGLEIKVNLPTRIRNAVKQDGSQVTVRIPPQMISLQPVSTSNGSEVIELKTTAAVTIKSDDDADQDQPSFTISGLGVTNDEQQKGDNAFSKISISRLTSSSSEVLVDLRSGYLVDLIKVKSDVYRFYFHAQRRAGQSAMVMIDPGHGGSEPGATYYSSHEKDFNLAMALKLGQVLEDAGYQVVYTRKDDSTVALNDRPNMANAEKPDLYISIHCNASTNAALNGTTSYYWTSEDPLLNQQRKNLATALQESLISRLGTTDKGVRTGEFVVIKYTTMPAALVETAFLSNQQDFARLSSEDFQWQVARGIADGIANYLNSEGITVPQTQKKADTSETNKASSDTIYFPF